MIDFQNGSVVKLHEERADKYARAIAPMLVSGEQIVACYQGIRDYVVFTTKRVIAVNVQGIGKRKDYTSLPYRKVTAFSVETSGVLDIDSELQMYFSGLGRVSFEFTGGSDIVLIGRMISEHIL